MSGSNASSNIELVAQVPSFKWSQELEYASSILAYSASSSDTPLQYLHNEAKSLDTQLQCLHVDLVVQIVSQCLELDII